MNGGFQANPEGLMQKGKNVTSIFEGYMTQKENVDKTADRVAQAWDGADSAGYVSAIHSYDEDFKKLGEVLEKMGDILYRHGARLADSRDALRQAADRL